MKNKTCKECKHFEADTVSAVCEKKRWICDDDAPACNRFEHKPKMTNGDKIRQMSNEKLADYLSSTDVNACMKDRDYCKEETWKCDICWLEWLESEVESE